MYVYIYIHVYVILYQDLSLEFQCLNDIATYSHPEPLQYPTRTAGNHLGAPTLELLNRPEPAPNLHNDLEPPHNSHWNRPNHPKPRTHSSEPSEPPTNHAGSFRNHPRTNTGSTEASSGPDRLRDHLEHRKVDHLEYRIT